MDPLGAQPKIIEVNSLLTWNKYEVPEYDIKVDDPKKMRASPFPWNIALNDKIALW